MLVSVCAVSVPEGKVPRLLPENGLVDVLQRFRALTERLSFAVSLIHLEQEVVPTVRTVGGRHIVIRLSRTIWVAERNLLPGWQLSGTGRANSGQPFTPTLKNTSQLQGEPTRPDRIAAGSLANPTPQAWFDLAAFPIIPTSALRFGNSGRNILTGPGFMALTQRSARASTSPNGARAARVIQFGLRLDF